MITNDSRKGLIKKKKKKSNAHGHINHDFLY